MTWFMVAAIVLVGASGGEPSVASSCEKLTQYCERCDTSGRELDALQECARSLYEADEAQCAARIAPTRKACR